MIEYYYFTEPPANSTNTVSKVFISIGYFLSKLACGSFESIINSIDYSEVSPLEEEQFNASRCKLIEKISNFSEIILVKHTSECSLVMNKIGCSC